MLEAKRSFVQEWRSLSRWFCLSAYQKRLHRLLLVDPEAISIKSHYEWLPWQQLLAVTRQVYQVQQTEPNWRRWKYRTGNEKTDLNIRTSEINDWSRHTCRLTSWFSTQNEMESNTTLTDYQMGHGFIYYASGNNLRRQVRSRCSKMQRGLNETRQRHACSLPTPAKSARRPRTVRAFPVLHQLCRDCTAEWTAAVRYAFLQFRWFSVCLINSNTNSAGGWRLQTPYAPRLCVELLASYGTFSTVFICNECCCHKHNKVWYIKIFE